MRFRRKLTIAALAATTLLAIGIASATARNLSVNEKNFELIWSEILGAPKTRFEFIDRATNLNIQCRITLLGRFNERTIIKETVRDQGTINHGAIESCGGGSLAIKTETFPWGLRYRGFTGTLPRIVDIIIGLIGGRFHIREPGGAECEWATETSHPMSFILGSSAEATETGLETTGEPNNVTAERGAKIPFRGEFLCDFAGEGEVGGIGLITNLPRTDLIRITLI